MANNECIPFYENGDTITVSTPGAVSGKTFAKISASRPYGPGFSLTSTDSGGGNLVCETATAGSKPFGVFANDQPVAEGKVAVVCGVGFIVPVTAAVALIAGEDVAVGANGQVTKYSNAVGAAATANIGKVASNNALTLTSVAKDSSGNNVQILIKPLTASAAFAINVVGNLIEVTLKTSAGSVSEVTATELIAKLAASAAANALLTAANTGASTGAGLVEPQPVTNLSGGGDARAVGMAVSACNAAEDAQIKLY
jgi:hypothetical protein